MMDICSKESGGLYSNVFCSAALTKVTQENDTGKEPKKGSLLASGLINELFCFEEISHISSIFANRPHEIRPKWQIILYKHFAMSMLN
jgi:hypothetical protein